MDVIMNNKPKYHIFKNTKYALGGLVYAFKTESSFKLELLAGIFIIPMIFILNFEAYQQAALLITAIFVLIIELVNSAIENVVDLVTKEIHPLAKSAKDIGSTAVMFSIMLHVALWILFLIK
jgi:diacylglycerol kinase (ATP)